MRYLNRKLVSFILITVLAMLPAGTLYAGQESGKNARLVEYLYENELHFNEYGLAVFEGSDGKFGLVNRKGEVLSEAIFDYISSFENGVASIQYNDYLRGTIDINGNVKAPYKVHYSSDFFSEGYAGVWLIPSMQAGFIDKEGKVLFGDKPTSWRSVGRFSNGYATVSIDNYDLRMTTSGIIDKNLKYVLDPVSSMVPVLDTIGGYAIIYITEESEYKVIRLSDGKVVFKSERRHPGESEWMNLDISNGILVTNDYSRPKLFRLPDYINPGKFFHCYPKGLYDVEKGEFIGNRRFYLSYGFSEGLLRILGTNISDFKWPQVDNFAYCLFYEGFMDMNGNLVIDGKDIARKCNLKLDFPNDLVFNGFVNGYSVFFYRDPKAYGEAKYGLIDKKGNVVIKPKYKFLGNYSEGLMLATEVINGKEVSKYIDINEKTVIKLKDDMDPAYQANYCVSGEFHDGYAAVASGEVINNTGHYTFGYIDRKGDWAVKPEFFEARDFHEGFGFVVEKGTGQGYFIDNKLQPLGFYKSAEPEKRIIRILK